MNSFSKLMELSVIIVNYNVKYFLEHCLHSVYRSMENLQGEIIVVDNNSADGSCQMIRKKFPEVILIENKVNTGFSKANNQGIRIARGKYILILNPDTVVQENTFKKCFDFMEASPGAGAVGVKMIDGKGNFLPESKRSLPTPAVSFYKIFGLSKLFPKSKIFGRYHLGYLNNDEVNKVEILTGAFMFIRKSVLDKIGLLDETFFMYGEDIDLSYRIIQAGYSNYYFPETTIIHYKGESTKKGSINYVIVFYKAMIIFAQKHFSPKYARLFSLLINLAIYIRASVSIIRRITFSLLIPVADALLIYTGFRIIEPAWERFKFGTENYYPEEYLMFAVPAYIVIWLVSIYLLGGYEKRVRVFDLIRGLLAGTVVLLLIYALLPENIRYSRALILFGAIWSLGVIFFTRLTIGSLFRNIYIILGKQKKRIIIAGSIKEGKRVLEVMTKADIHLSLIGFIDDSSRLTKEHMGNISQIEDIISINKIDEIVFCAQDIPSENIIKTMLSLGDSSVEFKIAPPQSLSIIGSNSINTAGELYIVQFNSLGQNVNKRKKRIFDISIAFLLLLSYPVSVFKIKQPVGLIRNILFVILGIRTWVGFHKTYTNASELLPGIPVGILTPIVYNEQRSINAETIDRLNLLYAKDYKIWNDLSIIIRDFKFLGN